MHIGLLTADLSPRHGWGQYGRQLALALSRAGVRVTIIAARNSPKLTGMKRKPMLPNLVPRERGQPLRLWLARSAARKALQDCSLLHVTVEPYALLASWTAGKRPYLITAHGSFVNSLLTLQGWRGGLYRSAFENAARIICVSGYTEAQLQSRLPDLPSVVIANGVDIARFSQMTRPTMPSAGPPTVLAVGAIKPRKGILPLVDSIAAARQQFPDLRCHIIGEMESNPRYVLEVRAAIARHGLQGCLNLLGSVDEETLLAHYATADLFVLATERVGGDFEGFGLVYAEAAAAGLPIIASDAGGAAEMVEDGVNGLLLPAAQLRECLPGAIVSLLSDGERARKMGIMGRKRALARSWDSVATQLLTVYEGVLRG